MALRPYEPGLSPEFIKQKFGLRRVVKLASNENPLGASPMAVEAAQRSLRDLARYPDSGLGLRQKLAARFAMGVENVIVGAGSEGLMANVVRTFLCDDDEILTTEAAFAGFQILAQGRGVPYKTAPYRVWRYDLPALADRITAKTKLIYLANPNNPTGTFFTRAEFEEFHRRVPARVLIIVDEAYFEFAAHEPEYPDSLHYRFDNVITLRTFSKVYGLASLRVGYGFAHGELISVLHKVKLPFEPSGTASAAAIGALEDQDFVQRTVSNNTAEVEFLCKSLRSLGLKAIPSAANFIMVDFESETRAQRTFEFMLSRGVILRPLAATGLPRCLRISAGIHEENEICVDSLAEAQVKEEMNDYATTY